MTGELPVLGEVMDEYRRGAERSGVAVKPSLKVREPLRHPHVWEALEGDPGVAAYLGSVSAAPNAVAVLSAVKVTPKSVIEVWEPDEAEVRRFHAEARKITEARKSQRLLPVPGPAASRHAKADTGAAQQGTRAEDDPFELVLVPAQGARQTPLNVMEVFE